MQGLLFCLKKEKNMTGNTTVEQINSVVTEMKMVELSDGSKVPMPRLTNRKVVRLIKFVAGDGVIMYDRFVKWRSENTEKKPAIDEKTGEQMKDENKNLLWDFTPPSMEQTVEFALEILPDEKIAEILAIVLGNTAEETEEMDFFDTALIVTSFLDNTPIDKLTALVKKIRPKFRPVKKEDMNAAGKTKADTQDQPESVVPLKPSPQA
jgi:hypothetical protein